MIGDRQDFLRALADKLGQEYTADSVREILRVAENVAAGYDIRKTEGGEDAAGVDYLRAFLDAKRVQGRTEKTLARYEYMLTRMLAEVGAPVRSITAYHLRAYLMRRTKSGAFLYAFKMSHSSGDGVSTGLLIVIFALSSRRAITSSKVMCNPFATFLTVSIVGTISPPLLFLFLISRYA